MKNRTKNRLIGCTRWPGITRAARELCVSRVHLHRVLAGTKRDLHGYRNRYATWRREHGL